MRTFKFRYKSSPLIVLTRIAYESKLTWNLVIT